MSTDTETIIPDEVIVRHMREIVAEKGDDYTYDGPIDDIDGCMYFDGHKPCCIVGHLLDRLGLQDLADEGASAKALDLPLSPTAVTAIVYAQKAQDRGKTWGEALSRFEIEMSR